MSGSFNDFKFSTLVDLLRYRALHQPGQLAFTFLQDGETASISLTYQELDRQARAIATQLQSLGATGSLALLLYPPGLEFIAAFFGCLYAGAVAIPAYPPRRNQNMSRLQAIVASSQAAVALTTTSLLTNIRDQFAQNPELAALRWLATDNIASNQALDWQEPALSSDTLAFLQYTSGSTGTPKGVMVSHGNLLHNERMIERAFGHTEKTIVVGWLPLFHDMGLIGNVLQPLYLGRPCILMSPVDFLQKPFRWLQAISRYKATTSGGPNFAYDLACRKITPEQRATLDLSSWEVAFNGAEPVRAETLERFTAAFEPCGFRASAFYPCYGMAETTLIVSGGLKAAPPVLTTVQGNALLTNRVVSDCKDNDDARTLVGCGQTLLDQQIVIAHPETLTRCRQDEVGEIWVNGPSVAQGYWRRAEETETTFQAYLADTGEGPFLRTGDLGFLKDGELFVTGRLKDLIIIRGRNHYPQDIEMTVEQSHTALRPGCSAAFSVDVNGEERLVVACEVERQYLRKLDVDATIKNICQAVVEQHELEVYAILLLKTGNIPKTSSGKIQRRACRAGFMAGSLDVVWDWSTNPQSKVKFRHLLAEVESLERQLQTPKQQQNGCCRNNASKQESYKNQVHKSEAIQAWLVSKIAQRLRVNPEDIDVWEPFARYGLDSVAAVSLAGELEDWLGRRLSPTLVYDYPTIAALVQHLAKEPDLSGATFKDGAPRLTEKEAIAIIGLGCRFPGANDPAAFWQLLHSRVDAIIEVPVSRWDINAFYNSEPATPGKMSTRWGGFLEQVDQFDPHFFGISPREAQRMDPQQRLLLEVAWEALENAGQAPNKLAGSQTGVFIGISSSDYSRFQYEDSARIDAYTATGNALSIAANRLSYLLDLRGPSLAVDTACSSSLIAVHLACQSLHNQECNLALAGGVNLILSPELTITFSQARMMAADGRCKTFDADADGYVRGEGCGLVILKRLSDALRDKDNILALIGGSAINQDGRSNGLTAPNGPSQQTVIRQALENAGVAPVQISYVETHGTGTALGDPIEVESLKAVLLPGRSQDQPCILGSVKANIGHLEAAAGIASLIKVVLSLQHGEIPPQLHLNQLNPHISLEGTSFSIPKERQLWPASSKRRFAGVSSFGFGGTNAHVVLEEAPVPTKAAIDVERPVHLLTLSAKSENALQSLARHYEAFLETNPQVSLADVCFTANTGRPHFAHRLASTTESTLQLREQLGAFTTLKQTSGLVSGQVQSRNRPKIAFLFTGQGSQYRDMGLKLYETQPTFRQALQRCDELLTPYLEQPLLQLLYPGPDATNLLHETAYTQPALFALEYALAELWRSWGIVPDAVMGHSVGEYVAACVAGVFRLEDGLKLVVERSRLMQSLPQDGEMAVVFADESRVVNTLARYESRIAIAAVNGPENIVISGAKEAVQSALEQFKSQGIAVQPMQVSHAFHSPLMDPILDEFERQAIQVQFKAPRIALISNLTGQMLKPGEIPDASYWRRHIRESVQFAAGMNTLVQQGYEIFLEIGPRATLLGMGKRCLPKGKGFWLHSLQQGQDDWRVLLNSLGVLETQGVDVDWAGFDHDYQRRRVPLPTYPFERKRYWIESDKHRDVNLMDVKESDTQLLKAQVDTTPKITQKDSIRSKLCTLVAHLLQTDSVEIDVHAPFLEMGADSIVLVEAVRTVENTFGIKVTIRQLFEELTNIELLAAYIDQNLLPQATQKKLPQSESDPDISPQQLTLPTFSVTPADTRMDREVDREDRFPQPEAAPSRPTQQAALPTVADKSIDVDENRAVDQQDRTPVVETGLERIMAQQLQVMSQQLELLQKNRPSSIDKSQVLMTKAFEQTRPANNLMNGGAQQPKPTNTSSEPISSKTEAPLVSKAIGPYEPLHSGAMTAGTVEGVNLRQQQHLEALIASYTKRTQGSKRAKQSYHHVLADSRASAGFRPSIKEMVYPIICQRSQGSRFWDVDGNEYVDITMGFGVHLFGHSPPFIIEALEEQIKLGTQVGPQPNLAGEVAELFCSVTGMERVAFCQSGSEAVMVSLRLARTATGRTKIALFSGSYHGHFDGVLARAQASDEKLVSVPIAPGVSPHMVEDVVVLDYGDPQALEYIEAHAHELAAVLVEPVQSRRPDLQPQEFLVQLRQLTAKAGTALIFDEIITGFRIHPGGAQAHFGVKADLATYGKIPGGGMPFAAVAGKAIYMNGIDGGVWNYKDASYPQAERTFFAGTFNKHPLALAGARAVFQHLQSQGSPLLEQLNQRTAQLAATLNAFFEEEHVPIQVVYFGSLFRFAFKKNLDLFFYHLIEKGVYVWEGRTCFLSTAHTDEDIAFIIQAVKDSVAEMRQGGFLPELPSNAPKNSFLGVDSALAITKQTNGIVVRNQPDASKNGFGNQRTQKPTPADAQSPELALRVRRDVSRGINFSLYYFGNYESEFSESKYKLLLEGAKFADRHDFTALLIPERHFHSFGGFSPNPSVIAAALARETERIQLRAGSVVLPLHHPIRVAEEWSVVDNLSKGRVGISFASGWHPNDFVFAPESYGNHRELMFQEIQTVQKLWRGESIQVRDGAGSDISVKLFPMPMQPDLPIWVTIVNNPDTYIRAGAIGAGVLTNLMGQTIEDLTKNIALYRESLSQHGYDPESGNVTVLLHTFVGDDVDIVREKARKPFYKYLQSTVGLFQNLVKSQGLKVDINKLSQDDIDYLLSTAYERYVQMSALIGTQNSCLPILDNLIAIGVDEIACFVDFGLDTDSVFEGLHHLNLLKKHYKKREYGVAEKLLLPPTTTFSSALEANSEVVCTVPLTEAQKQLWVLAQMGDDASSAYNESIMLQLQGSLHLGAIRRAVQKVIARHESLRTIISSQGDVQQILPNLTIDVFVIDFSSLDTTERETKVTQWLEEESQKSFDLTQGPLLRINLLKLEEQQHLLVFTAHHIVVDGLSIGLLLQDVSAFYSAECQGVVCQQEPPLQFREYILWQEQQSQSAQMAKNQAYWLGQFADSVPILELPCDRPRSPVKTYRGARVSQKLEANLCAEIKKLSKQKGCTLFMTLLAGYLALLHRLTNQDDIAIGIPVANRTLEGSEKMVGNCADLLPIRSVVERSPAFSEYLVTIRRVLLDAYEHQNYPFAKLLNQLNLHRDPSRSPLVTATFNLDRPGAVPQIFGLDLELMSPFVSYAKFDIHLNVIELKDELRLEVDYNTDLFDATTITRMLGHFQNLLAGIVANQEQCIADLPLLSESERHQLLVGWNDTKVEYPQDQCIHQLFEVQVERTPDAVAVVFEDQQLTYSQLNRRANQLAHHLRSLNVGPEVLVGICVERSLEMVIGLLGILKAGGAYVPLDPSYPQERLASMLEDAQVPVLIIQEHLLETLPKHQAQVLCLDAGWGDIAQESEENPVIQVTPNNLAYVIYTSGSTGKPKGVMNTHSGICNRLLWMQDAYQLTASDRVLQKTPYSFDVSVWEFFWTLFTGACLVVAKPGGHQDSAYLVKLISEQNITTVHFVPSMLQIFLEEQRLDSCNCLRQVMCSGEALPFELSARFKALLNAELHNLYGPTEAAVDVTFWTCERALVGRTVPIGHPIANIQIYILDTHLQPVPVGVPGELHIGGVGLARGYLNRPDLTSEKFIPNPFSNEPGARLYKTGDLTRYLPDGNIEYLGRIDNQVKIRGFRIELGEIEAVLGQHPAVRETLVMATSDQSGDKRLVAYVVGQASPPDIPNQEQFLPTTSELRSFLKEQLPDYMVPGAFVILDTLPLTPNGKVDRRALPAFEPSKSGFEEGFVAPSTHTEELLANLWAEVLGLKQVGIHDNFFDLGGHSLQIIQVHRKVQEIFDSNISVVDLFIHPTISALAQYLSQKNDGGQPVWSIDDLAKKQKNAITRQKQLMKQRKKANG